jgi:hypothetical protein
MAAKSDRGDPWRDLRAHAIGAALAVFLGTFVFWIWEALVVKQRLGCEANELPAVCFREWLLVAEPGLLARVHSSLWSLSPAK